MCWTRALDESQTIAANLRIEAVKQPASRCDNDNTLVFMRIDGRYALVGIDKQPFPVERHRLDRQRFARSCHWRQGVELVRPDPCAAAEQNDRKGRDGPDHELDASRVGSLGQAACLRIGSPKPVRKAKDCSTIASMIASESIRIVFSANRSAPAGRGYSPPESNA
jgi:hypothetical protein